LAAKNNQVELLKQICVYDEHIGRVNYAHQTPLGVAKFFRAKDCQRFLQDHYKYVDISQGRNAVGDIWWDRPIDEMVGDWEVQVNFRSERLFVNKRTGEVTKKPPAVPVEVVARTAKQALVPMRRKVVLVKEENTLNKHAYYQEYDAVKNDVEAFKKFFRCAATIQKFARRKLVYKELARLKLQAKKNKVLRKFFFIFAPRFKIWKDEVKFKAASKIQSLVRLRQFRKAFYSPAADGGPSRFRVLEVARAKRKVRRLLWRAWQALKGRRIRLARRLRRQLPTTLADWQVIIDRAGKPVRTVGVFEEYEYPSFRDVYFYRHVSTGTCYLDKPDKLRLLDDQAFREKQQIQQFGATLRQVRLAVKLQALVRGHQVRAYAQYVERAMEISLHAAARYLENPLKDSNLFNYTLHCYVVQQDMDRARLLFAECLDRMSFKGPDIPFVLYSYAIFAFVSHDLDYHDVVLLLERARKAEQQILRQKRQKHRQQVHKKEEDSDSNEQQLWGRSFEFANTGFFRHSAHSLRNELAWHCFAACRFLVFNDFPSSFDAFLEAFRWGPKSKRLKANFDLLLTHFHGDDKAHQQQIVLDRMRKMAQADAEGQETRRLLKVAAQQRQQAATRIQRMWRRRMGLRRFNEAHRELKSRLRGLRERRGQATVETNSSRSSRRESAKKTKTKKG